MFRPNLQVLGSIKTDTDIPLPNIQIAGELTGATGTYSVATQSDTNGEFTFNVISGDWIFFPWNLPKEYEKPKSQTLSIADDSTLTFVAAPDVPGLQIEETKLPDGIAGELYKSKLTASGGSQPYVWSVPDGSQLPGQLTISTYTGEIKGVLTQSGLLTFDVKVEELRGSREGIHRIELFVERDVTAPEIKSVTPSSFTPTRDNTVTAIHFSEPMIKIAISDSEKDQLAFNWTFGGPGSLTELPASEFNFAWNESGDTFYISHPAPFPIGSHSWTLNPDPFTPNSNNIAPLIFEDTSGNAIAPNTGRKQSIRSTSVTENEEGQPVTYRDVEEILLLKEQLQKQEGRISNFRAATLDFTIGLPVGTFNTVLSASVTHPNEEVISAPYFGIYDGGSSLHFLKLVSRFDDLNRRYPNGIYEVNLETFHDGVLSMPVNLLDDNYPKPALIANPCAAQHIFSDQDFSLSILNTLNAQDPKNRGDASIIQIVINKTNGKKLHSLQESPGGEFEVFLRAGIPPEKTQQGQFGIEELINIPADTLNPNTDYFGYIRKIKIVDENTSYENVRVIGGYSTVTEFTLSTKNPRVACPSGIVPFWAGPLALNTPPQSAQNGMILPEVFTTATSDTDTAEFNIGTATTIVLAPNTIGTIDTSGQDQRAIVMDLLEGQAQISSSALGISESKFIARTPIATLDASTANAEISHSQETGLTTFKVSEGSAQVYQNDSTLPPTTLLAGEQIVFPAVETAIPELPPTLNIAPSQGNGLQFSWSHSTNDWQLFQSDSIPTGVWTPVGIRHVEEGNQFSVNLEANEEQQFFRLQKSLIVID